MRFQTLNDWLRWQERLHPSAIDLGLERVAAVWQRMRPAGLDCPVITVGGTNGKGSCVAMLESILQSAGYRTGCYTSPHLLRYNERIHLDDVEVSDIALCEAFERVDQARNETSLTYFEFGTLAALDLFAGEAIDLAILEVGLGGRLDAVNVLDADVALVTTVGLDHMAWLGEDLDSIAREKAGIFRTGRPAVIGQTDPPAGLLEAARATGAQVFLAGRDFSAEPGEQDWRWTSLGRSRSGLPRPALRSNCQMENAAAVLMVLECLSARFPVEQNAIRTGLQQVKLTGRLQVIPGEVTLVFDVAHNRQAARNLARDLGSLPCTGATHAVFACFRDKDAAGMVQALSPAVGHWHLASSGGERALPTDALEEALIAASVRSPRHSYKSVADALSEARRAARPGDRVLVTGSFLTVAAALESLSATNPGLV
jgi:dihydrofolate synthase/folylpolyglutamate synthase